MTVYNTALFDEKGRTLRPILLNTAKDGSGTWYIPLVDSDGQIIIGAGTASIGKLGANSGVDIGDVDVASIAAGTNRIGKVMADVHEVRVSKAIDASIGAYTAGDVVNDDDCCVTATAWVFTGMANAAGGCGVIWGSTLFNETENQTVQYELILFNAVPTGELTDNSANTNPVKGDRASWVGTISYPASEADGATVATTSQASPSTPGGLPLFYKCAAGSTSLWGVLITKTAYTQTATDDIEIAHLVEHF